MAVSLTSLSMWFWRGKEKETTTKDDSSMSSSFDFGLGFREPESKNYPRIMPKQKPRRREDHRIDKEFDVVVVSSNDDFLSELESDEVDLSVGWMEPHSPDFFKEGLEESSFAVIVPCYVKGSCGLENARSGMLAASDLSDGYSHESRKYVEEFLSSLQNN